MQSERIDLNADLGESPGDVALMAVVTSASIACGGHVGDADSMARAVAAARSAGVAIGAHPSYRDRENFGRLELGTPNGDVAAEVVEQVGTLEHIAGLEGARVDYLKFHGALYHRAGRDKACAEAVLEALEGAGVGPRAVLAQPGAAVLEAARERGWATVEEGFCDRAYLSDGCLADRRLGGAVLTDAADVARQAVGLALGTGVDTLGGGRLDFRPASLCLHGDTPSALELARAVRGALEQAGVIVASFAQA